jgi:hypothetical protein
MIPTAVANIAPDGRLTARKRRRLMLEMTARRVRPGAGSSHGFLQRRTAVHSWPDLRQILDQIDWVIVGGVATRAFMPERMTKDMDILIRERDRQEVLTRLQEAGYQQTAELTIPGCQLLSPEGVEIDLLLGDYPWLEEALSRPQTDPAGYPVLALPYLVLMKLAASRSQDMADISRMLGWADETELTAVRQAVAHYSPQDSDDLETMIFIGQQEQGA